MTSTKQSKTDNGKERSAEHVTNWKESRTNGAGWVVSAEQKKLQSISMSGEGNHMFGRKQSNDTKTLMREKALMRPKLTCPHCGKVASVTKSKRWHLSKCHLLLDNNIT